MLIGNVGKEPDVRYYDADQAVAQFPLATTERGYTLPNGTHVPDRTDWHNIVMWKNLAKKAERCIKATNSILRDASDTEAMTTRRASAVSSRKFMRRTWNCLLPKQALRRVVQSRKMMPLPKRTVLAVKGTVLFRSDDLLKSGRSLACCQ